MLVVVAEFMDPEGLALLSSGCDVHYDPALGDDERALRAALGQAAGLVVRNRVQVGPRLLAAAPRLVAVGRLGSGLDNIDRQALAQAGVALVAAPGANAVATAEFTLAMALVLCRGLGPAVAGGAGAWTARAAWPGQELAGRTFGIVGLGQVGQAVARLARAFGMRVLAAHPGRHPLDPTARAVGAALCPLPELLRQADVVSLHAALTPKTAGMIGQRELALVHPGTVLINTARGGLLDEQALATALREGWLAGAALDVRDPEPPACPDPLDGLPGLIRTPHIAGLTAEAQRLTGDQIAAGLLLALRGSAARSPAALAGRAAPAPL